MTNEKDKLVQELINIAQAKKAEISKAEKPTWLTNCSFGYDRNGSNKMNIRAVSDVDELVNALAFVIGKEKDITEANSILGTKTKLEWLGFSKDEWSNDFKTRIFQIQITEKKIELGLVESRLNKLISKEMRDQMEIDELSKILKS